MKATIKHLEDVIDQIDNSIKEALGVEPYEKVTYLKRAKSECIIALTTLKYLNQ